MVTTVPAGEGGWVPGDRLVPLVPPVQCLLRPGLQVQVHISLCVPESSLYAPHSFLLISSKSWMVGRTGGALQLCYLTALVQWCYLTALEGWYGPWNPLWALVHKTTYAPMIYTALCVVLLMRAASTTWASGRGLGPGNLDFFGPQMALLFRLDAFSCAQKSLDFQGPTPSHLSS